MIVKNDISKAPITISPLLKISPEWILKHGMHNGTTNSRFYAIASGGCKPHQLYSVSAKDEGNNKVIATLIFEEYPDTALYWGSFSKDRKRYLMNCKGRVGLYTTPEYRRRGIAHAISKAFCQAMIPKGIPNAINIIAHQHNISKFFEEFKKTRNWFPTTAPLGRNLWENQIKKEFSSIMTPISVTNKTAIETLIDKGWHLNETKNRQGTITPCLSDSSTHPEWGSMQFNRDEFLGMVP
jgi:GNAT superfamily N-acetyltransferase